MMASLASIEAAGKIVYTRGWSIAPRGLPWKVDEAESEAPATPRLTLGA